MDKNIVGNDDGLAIDDLSLSFTTSGGGGTSVRSVSGNTMAVSILGRATASRILVGFTAAKSGAFTLALFDLNGREVVRDVVNANTGENQISLAPQAIAAGQYILRVSNGSSIGTAKLVVE